MKNERLTNSIQNYLKGLKALDKSASTPILEARDLSGIIKDFEIVYELSWKTLKIFLLNEGHETHSAKDVFSKAYQLGYIKNQEIWLSMISDRNNTVHTYNEQLAKDMVHRIQSQYVQPFKKLKSIFDKNA